MSLTPIEEELAASLGFDPKICEYIKKNFGDRPLERALQIGDRYEPLEGDGISVLAPSADITAFLVAHRTYLVEHSYRPYLSGRHSAGHRSIGEELVVLLTDDPYEIVRQRKTGGPNYEVSNEDVLAKLKEWEQLCSFEIVQVDTDTLVLNLETLPVDLCGFAEDVFLFCPDTVHQGVGHVQEDEYPEVYAAARELCPHSATKAVAMALSDIVPDEDDAFTEEVVASTEMGVKLLAYSFQEAKQIFLWWD